MGGVGKSSGVATPLDRGSTRTTFDTPERQYIYDQSWLSILTTSVWDNVQIYAQANSNR